MLQMLDLFPLGVNEGIGKSSLSLNHICKSVPEIEAKPTEGMFSFYHKPTSFPR